VQERAVQERVRRVGEQLMPLFDRANRMVIRNLKAIKELRQGLVPAIAIGRAEHVTGLIDQLEPGLADGVSLFVPVIFTTARLWVADGGDISLADLNTGQLPSDWARAIKQVPWLWYTYNQSLALRHHVPSGGAPSLSLSKILRAEFARSIAVVGPDGIEPFLRADLATWLA
jgi:hypothetical protein